MRTDQDVAFFRAQANLGTDRVRPEKYEFARDMRKNPTQAEAALWDRIRSSQVAGMKFSRQRVIRGYVADFWCSSCRLVVEVDGGYHTSPEQQERDRTRDRAMQDLGITVLRVTNEEVLTGIEGVLERIRRCAR